MVGTEIVRAGDASLMGVRVDLPGAPALMLVGEKGFVGCGYFSVDVADKVGHALAVVSGVSSFEDVLEARVKAVSAAAAALGVSVGMTGSEAGGILA